MQIILKTERLTLRKFTLQDAGFMLELLNSPLWIKFIGDRNVKTLEGAEIYLQNGILKNYYYSEWDGKNQKFSAESLKEEGVVKNNFKFGEWKYYNNEGKIDSIKTYTLKDSVDVRFPHCIFNKKEPCY